MWLLLLWQIYDQGNIYPYIRRLLFTQYRNPNIYSYMDTVLLCEKYNIGVVGYDFEYIEKHKILISCFCNKNIKIFAFSSDDLKQYRLLKKLGVQGIFTNFISHDDEIKA